MKANELRIGSILSNAGGKIIKCTSQTISDFESGLIILKPIPLTEEWLLKFGFINGCLEIVNGLLLWVDDELWITYTNGVRSGCLSHIKHLHQLQNLYFALTGEELTLKSE